MWQVIIKEAVILMIVWFFFYKLSRYNGIPFVLVIMGVLVGLYHFITSKTVAGRQIYALGGNAKAAKLSGINTEKVFFWVYTNMGILSAIAGIVLSARNASATPARPATVLRWMPLPPVTSAARLPAAVSEPS